MLGQEEQRDEETDRLTNRKTREKPRNIISEIIQHPVEDVFGGEFRWTRVSQSVSMSLGI